MVIPKNLQSSTIRMFKPIEKKGDFDGKSV